MPSAVPGPVTCLCGVPTRAPRVLCDGAGQLALHPGQHEQDNSHRTAHTGQLMQDSTHGTTHAGQQALHSHSIAGQLAQHPCGNAARRCSGHVNDTFICSESSAFPTRTQRPLECQGQGRSWQGAKAGARGPPHLIPSQQHTTNGGACGGYAWRARGLNPMEAAGCKSTEWPCWSMLLTLQSTLSSRVSASSYCLCCRCMLGCQAALRAGAERARSPGEHHQTLPFCGLRQYAQLLQSCHGKSSPEKCTHIPHLHPQCPLCSLHMSGPPRRRTAPLHAAVHLRPLSTRTFPPPCRSCPQAHAARAEGTAHGPLAEPPCCPVWRHPLPQGYLPAPKGPCAQQLLGPKTPPVPVAYAAGHMLAFTAAHHPAPWHATSLLCAQQGTCLRARQPITRGRGKLLRRQGPA